MEENFILIIQGVISLIVLIVFFTMASNIAKIKRHFLKPSETEIENEIEFLEFKGETKEALDRYYNLAFLCLKDDGFHEDRAKRLDRLGIKINNLGGQIPEEMKKFIDKYKK